MLHEAPSNCYNTKTFEASVYLNGQISLEFCLQAQGTFVERLRARAAGIPAFYIPADSCSSAFCRLVAWLQSENGIGGMGPYPTEGQLDLYVYNLCFLSL